MSINNIDKIMSYIKPVSVAHCNHLFLNESLFYQDACAVCGKCCIHEDLIFLPFEVENMKSIINGDVKIDNSIHLGGSVNNITELFESLQETYVEVNGSMYVLYRSKLPYRTYHFEDRGTLNRCHWDIPVGDGKLGCGIHLVSSLTCKFPHVRLNYRKDSKTTYIGLMQYGRNWALKCPIKFNTVFGIENVTNRIEKFALLKKYCDYFHIDNYCDKIISALQQVNTDSDIKNVCNIDLIHTNLTVARLF